MNAVIISLLVAEAALQVGFRFVPVLRHTLLASWDERRVQLLPDPKLVRVGNRYWPEHDRSGFRNPRVLEQADLVALGDSTTYGQGAPPRESWPAYLERATGLSVYNMGLGGWGPVQATTVLDQALALKPKTIVLGFYFGNDLFDAFKAVYLYDACHQMRDPDLVAGFAEMHRTRPFLQEWERLYRRPATLTVEPPAPTGFGPVRRFLSTHVRLYGLARSLKNLTDMSPQPAAAQVVLLEELWHTEKASAELCRPQEVVYERESVRTILCPGHRCLILDTGDLRIAEGLRLSKQAIAGIRDRCQDEGVAFYVLLIPTKEFVFAPLVEQRESSPSLDKLAVLESEVRRDLSAWLNSEGVPAIDAWPALRDRARVGEQLYLPSVDDHPTGHGYRVIAEAVRAGLGL